MGNEFTKQYLRYPFAIRELKVVMIGLEAAGKTTMLYKMTQGEEITVPSTCGFDLESLKYKNVQFNLWDLGAHGFGKFLWKNRFESTQALIFVVDSSDRELLPEVRKHLDRAFRNEQLKDTVFLVLANKQDIPNCMTTTELIELLELKKYDQVKWHILPTCATSGDGLYDGLDWILENLDY